MGPKNSGCKGNKNVTIGQCGNVAMWQLDNEALPRIEANQDFKYSRETIEQIRALTIENNEVMVLFTLK